MYNLFVTADTQAWNEGDGSYELPRSRFLEHTEENIVNYYKELTQEQIAKIKEFPCLFLVENLNSDAYVGRLQSINVDKYKVEFKYTIVHKINKGLINVKTLISLGLSKYEIMRTHWAIKNIDLNLVLTSNNLINSDLKYTNHINYLNEDKASDKITSVRVSSLHDFMQHVLSKNKLQGHDVFYRGHSDSKYKLEPSINRSDDSGRYLYRDYENVMATELLVENPNDFNEDNTTLEKLVRMQHYSLPTRLLDITSNPLIALYFACSSHQNKKDGEVIVFYINQKSIKYFDSDAVSCLANISRLSVRDKESIGNHLQSGKFILNKDDLDLYKQDKNSLNSITKIQEFNQLPEVGRLLHFIREDKSYFLSKIIPNDLMGILCVKGKKSNGRIISQAGSFLLFGTEMMMSDFGTPEIEIDRIIIDRDGKIKILSDLDKMNINESTVYPYIENSARYIKKKYEKKSTEDK